MTYTVKQVCFEYAKSVSSQVFVLRNSVDHIRFYDRIDNSGLCRRPVERIPVNFDGEFAMIGLWTPATGCTGHHNLLYFEQNDDTKMLKINLKFIIKDQCDYDLLVPFWVGLSGIASYEVTVSVG